jgi:hypothetical protein
MSASSWRKNFPENYETNSSSHKNYSTQEKAPSTQEKDSDNDRINREVAIYLASPAAKARLKQYGLDQSE